MSKKYISQKELADFFGVKQPYISKLAKKGVFAYCYEGKKLLRDKAILAYTNNLNSDKSSPGGITSDDSDIAINIHTNESIMKQEVYTNKNINELKDLLKSTQLSPGQTVTIIKDFWNGKLSEQKYLEKQGTLVSIEDVVEAGQKIVKATRDKCLAIPTKAAPYIVGVNSPGEIELILQEHIYEALEELSRMEDL